MIPCTDSCQWQRDGLCTLDTCAAAGQPSAGHPCVHYVPISPAPADAAPPRCSAPAAAPVAAPAAEEEELVDDLELVAVITAAIAASTNSSTDSLVVRSIKRAPGAKWKRA